jgi:hypothetical protein
MKRFLALWVLLTAMLPQATFAQDFKAELKKLADDLTQQLKQKGNKRLTFLFHTTEQNEDDRLYGSMTVLVEGCKTIVRVINENRLFLSKKKPN